MKNKFNKKELIGVSPNSSKMREYKKSLFELNKEQW